MTEKQKLFCDEYLANGLNATQAYLKVYKNVKSAAVAATCAGKLLRIAEVKIYIEKRMAEIHSEKTADIAEVMEYLTSVMRGEMKDEILPVNASEPVSLRTPTRDRTKAAELLGKAHGLFEKNINLNVEVPVFSGEESLED